MRSFTLNHDDPLQLYQALTGDTEITDKSGFWPAYKAAVTLRNKIVHEGIEATEEQAQAALSAAKQLVAHVSKKGGLS